mgnify:CR=1 FL=1
MKLELQQSITANDLARALDNDSGTFLAQQGGQNFLVVAKEGHSIASIRPVGQRTNAIPSQPYGVEPWTITKLSETTDVESMYGYRQGAERR